MNDRFRFRVIDNRDWSDEKGTIYYDAEETYDYMCGKPKIPASCFGNLLDDDWIVEQCTGLKDKNGKLIYEGDIVYNGNAKSEVVFKDGAFRFKYNEQVIGGWMSDELEVIGNIHETLED